MTTYTPERYQQMVDECRQIVQEFYLWCSSNVPTYDPDDPEFDIDDCAVSEERFDQFFSDLCNALDVHPSKWHFRDNDYEYGKYSEQNNNVLFPYCIYYDTPYNIASSVCHELYHAFQYRAICNPTQFPIFSSDTIKQWAFEFDPKNYENGDRDPSKYRDQEIEKSARDFARITSIV